MNKDPLVRNFLRRHWLKITIIIFGPAMAITLILSFAQVYFMSSGNFIYPGLFFYILSLLPGILVILFLKFQMFYRILVLLIYVPTMGYYILMFSLGFSCVIYKNCI